MPSPGFALQLNPPWHIVTPLGEGFAFALLDYGPAHVNSCVVFAPFDGGFMAHVDLCECKPAGNAMYDIPHPEPIKDRNI